MANLRIAALQNGKHPFGHMFLLFFFASFAVVYCRVKTLFCNLLCVARYTSKGVQDSCSSFMTSHSTLSQVGA